MEPSLAIGIGTYFSRIVRVKDSGSDLKRLKQVRHTRTEDEGFKESIRKACVGFGM